MTEESDLWRTCLEAAVAYVRNPHKELRPARATMDLCEIGARRFISWLRLNGYVIVKIDQDPRRLACEQIREYIARYYPGMGDVDIEIDGNIASVTEKTGEEA